MLCRTGTPELFWAWFRDHAEVFAALNRRTASTRRLTSEDEALVSELAERLAEVDPRIFPYTGLARDGTNELILSTDGNPAAFPAVFEMARQAPDMTGWRFIPLKPRAGIAGRIDGGGVSIDCEKLRFFLDREFDPPVLVLLTEEDVEEDFDAYQFLGSAVALQVLGEHDFAAAIGEIGVISREAFLARFGHDGAPLDEIDKELPPRALH